MKNFYLTFLFCLITGFLFEADAEIIYVNSTATGMDNGTSWENAYTDLQDALMNADQGDSILVAAGTYLPGTASNATFLIDKNLTLLGGFPAAGGTLEERDPAAHETILSGDLNGDDVDDDFDSYKSDNAKNVVTITSTALLDGFTIQYGNADTGFLPGAHGGGVHSYQAAPIIRNCTFKQNYAIYDGGALYLSGIGSQGAVVEKCRFEHNRAGSPAVGAAGGAMEVRVVQGAGVLVNECYFIENGVTGDGGGLWSLRSNLTVKNSTFTGNTSENLGGGLYFWSTSEPDLSLLVDSCTFIGNHARSGGGIRAALGANCTASITNSIFEGNEVSPDDTGETPSGAGVLIFSFSNDPNSSNPGISMDNCHFQANISSGTASAAGLAINAANTTVSLTNSTFLENECTGNGSTVGLSKNNGSGTVTVENCRLENNVGVNSAGLGFAVRKSGSVTFTVRDCQILNNQANQYGGGLYFRGDINSTPSFLIEDCEIKGNSAGEKGGAILVNTSSSNFHATLNRCEIQNNESPGGSVIGFTQFELDEYALPTGATLSLENSLITDNAGGGEAIRLDSFPGFQLLNTTIVDNAGSGLMLDDHSGVSLQNTILANPGYEEYIGSTGSVVTSNGGNLVLDNSLNDFLTDQDKPEMEPDFIPETFKPAPTSPLINGGVNEGVTAMYDLAGMERIQEDTVDIGAYECPCPLTTTQEVIIGELGLSPNPATDFLHLQLPETISKPVEASLFDVQGRLINQQLISTGQSINVKDLVPGTYWLKVRVDEKVYSGKFVKQ